MTNLNDGQLTEEYRGQEQHEGGKGQGGIPILQGDQKESLGQQQGGQEHPTLFGQNQLQGGFGPVYAIPSFPWQDGHSQGLGNSQWQDGYGQGLGSEPSQQWGSHPQAIMPYCMWYPVGYRYY